MTFDDNDHQRLDGRDDNDAHSQYLLAESADERMERGGNTTSGTDASAQDDGWDSSTGTSTSVSFGTAFGSAPTVVVASDNPNDTVEGYQTVVGSRSTTSFNAAYLNYSGTDHSTDTYATQWVAVGDE